jgi:hypothetical protein
VDRKSHPIARIASLGAMSLGLSVAACTASLAPDDEERRIGLIFGFDNDDPRIVLPDTVEAGVEFIVEVTTYGNGCKRKGETEVALSGDTVIVTPYDYFNVSAAVCEDILQSFVHEAVVELGQEGEGHVRVIGRDGAPFPPEVVHVDQAVFVRTAGDPD